MGFSNFFAFAELHIMPQEIILAHWISHWTVIQSYWHQGKHLSMHLGGCGSEPASCYRKVVGSIPLVCMLKCPWARCWTPNCSWCAGRHLAWQPSPSVYECMNYCKSLWTSVAVSAKCQFKGDISVINGLNFLHCSLFQIHYVLTVRTNKKALNIHHLVCIDYW